MNITYSLYLIGVITPQLVAIAALQIAYRRGGLLSLAHGAVMGIGGYAYALTLHMYHGGIILALIIGMSAASASALLLYPMLNNKRQFILATLALQLLFTAFCKASVITGGEGGIRGLKPSTSLGLQFTQEGYGLLIVEIIFCAALLTILFRLEKSSLDLKFRAAGDDPDFAQGFGLNSRNIRLAMLGITSAAVGAAGVFSAAFRGGVSPDDFGLGLSVLLLSATALAWNNSVLASLITGVLLICTAEAIRILNFGTAPEKILYGLLIIIAMGRGRLYD